MFKGDRESMEEARAGRSRMRMLRTLHCSVDAGKRRIYYRIRVTGFSASTHAATQSVLPALLRISGQNGV
jgi:hypothetical protein